MENEKLDTQLTTQTEDGRRLSVYPAVVKGVWYQRRKIFQWLLLIVFLSIPWLEWNSRPLLQFNIVDRRFFLFGLDLWATDAPLIFFVFAILAFGLFFATALFGRVWCGWACPQTVFIERVFRQVEIWIEGNHIQRKKLAEQDWNWEKFFKRFSKYAIFSLLAWVVSNTFLAYFVGKDNLLEMMATSPSQNPTSFAVMMVFFGGVCFDFVWFREQFCTLVCPYGRFQSVLMDQNSLLVAYDEKRGEPRGKLQRQPTTSSQGDCIDCKKCVAVCPTGIDIRNGTQMECIACTACIDACDDVMEKIGKDKGLIRYSSERELQGRSTQKLNVRTIAYSVLLLGLVSALGYSLAQKSDLSFQVLRSQGLPYQILTTETGEKIQNVLQIKVLNQADVPIRFSLVGVDSGAAIDWIHPLPEYEIGAKKSMLVSVMLRFDPKQWQQRNTQLIIRSADKKELERLEISLAAPSF